MKRVTKRNRRDKRKARGKFFAELVAGVGAGGKLLEGIGSFLDDGEQVSGFELPPEFEVQFINQTQDDLKNIDLDIERTLQLEDAFSSRLDTVDQVIKGTIPEQEALQRLTESSQRIAEAFAGDIEQAIAQGFLTEEDRSDLDRLGASSKIRDPQLEAQIDEQRAQLEQELRRSGASPAGRAIALSDFERRAEQQRFGRSQDLRGQRLGVLQTRSSLRQQGFQKSLQGFGAVQSQLDFARKGAGALSNTALARLQAGQQGVGLRQGLRTERQNRFTNLGQFDFSGRTQDLLASGQIGPGTVASQIGNPSANPSVGRFKPRGTGHVEVANLNRKSREDLEQEALQLSQTNPNSGQGAVQAAQDRVRIIQEELERRRLQEQV